MVVIGAERTRIGTKSRPWLVVQADAFNAEHGSITVCMISSQVEDNGLFRIAVAPTPANGLRQASVIAIDVLLSLSRRSIDGIAGEIEFATMQRVDEALRRWLDL